MSARRRLVVAVWIVLLVGGALLARHQSDRLSAGGWDVPGSASSRAADALARFPGSSSSSLSVFIEGRTPQLARRRLAEVAGELRRQTDLHAGHPLRFEGGRALLLPLRYSGTADAIDAATELRKQLVETDSAVRTRVIGEPASWSNFQEVAKRQLAEGEAIGLPLTLIILLAAFGTLVAALTPVGLALVAVVVTGAMIYLLSGAVLMSVYVTNMASMFGIGVAVDYSLFIVSRFRRELRAGTSRDEALARAFASSGTAVVFSGATVVVSLTGLFLIDVNAIRSIAIGAILVVAVAVSASMTLLPALLGAAGSGIERLRVRLPWRTGEAGAERFWRSWTTRVTAHPIATLALGTALMLTIAAPVLWIQTLNRGLEQLPRDSEVRAATERITRLTGPGFFGPVHVLVSDRPAAREIAREARGASDVVSVGPIITSADRRLSLVDVTLAADPESKEARAAYRRLEAAARPIAARHKADLVLGGATAFGLDIERAIFGGIWRMMLFVLLVSYVVLLVLLRSVVLPLKAVLMNLLTLGDWTGYDSPGYVETIVPALVLAVTFGLSMDYEVFLLTRIRERYLAHGSNSRAVAEGLTASARIVTSAAAIMIAVFGAFSIAGSPSLRELGVGLGVAVFLDATVVRLVLVPATMQLLGDWNWWLPARLERALPRGSSGVHPESRSAVVKEWSGGS